MVVLKQPSPEGADMKFTTEDLLLAAQVRSLAEKIGKAALARAEDEWERKQLSTLSPTPQNIAKLEAARSAFKTEWLKAHPIVEFGPAAVRELENMAEVIGQAR
jgi:hypothetical protein